MKNLLLGIIFLLLLNSANAQHYRKADKNLDIFYKLNPSSEISLLFNQPSYMPGDTAYFLLRLVNSVDFKPVKKKTVLHLLLVDKTGQKIYDQFVFMKDGFASNQIIIPPTVHPGIYRLLCLNEKVNAQELLYQRTFEIEGGTKETLVDTVQSISVFPEGGSILEGAENKIFVLVRPVNKMQLKILDGTNSQVATLKTNDNGIGSFFLTPKRDQTFKVSGVVNGKSIITPLSIKERNGVSFKSVVSDGKLKITGRIFGFRGRPEIVLLKNDRVYSAEKIKLDSSKSFFSEISLGETLKGLFQLWIIDADKVLASRILYANPVIEDDMLSISHPTNTQPRSKIEIRIKKIDTLMKGNFSVRVYPKSIFTKVSNNIFADLELTASWTAKSIAAQDALLSDSVNDVLATQQWPKYNIDSLYKGKFKIKKVSFDQGYIIKGKCTNLQNPDPSKPVTITLYFESSNLVEEAVLDKDGNFSIELTDPISLKEKVYYMLDVDDMELANRKLEISNINKVLSPVQTVVSQGSNPYYSYKVLTDSIQRSYNYFSSESKSVTLPTKAKGMEARLFGADKIYNMADYQAFASMKDIIVEIIGRVTLKKINGKSYARMYLDEVNSPNPVLAKGNPLFIIDGIPTTDSEFFLNLKPSKIDKIKIVWKVERSVLKSFGNNGIIVVETKDASSTANIPALNHFWLSGFSSPLSFWIPQNLSDTRFPYFRSCLYWNPMLQFDKDGVSQVTFLASDYLGEYVVDVEGLTIDGIPYSRRSSFSITSGK